MKSRNCMLIKLMKNSNNNYSKSKRMSLRKKKSLNKNNYTSLHSCNRLFLKRETRIKEYLIVYRNIGFMRNLGK
jgi:hypothetical protein